MQICYNLLPKQNWYYDNFADINQSKLYFLQKKSSTGSSYNVLSDGASDLQSDASEEQQDRQEDSGVAKNRRLRPALAVSGQPGLKHYHPKKGLTKL